MAEVDWTGAPWLEESLESFLSVAERQEEGTYTSRSWPQGEGAAQHLMVGIAVKVEEAYARLVGPEDFTRFESAGEVPIIRNGQRVYEPLDSLTLRDLPVILNTLVILEEEHRQREGEESERKTIERKERERVRAKERRKLKKLGEW